MPRFTVTTIAIAHPGGIFTANVTEEVDAVVRTLTRGAVAAGPFHRFTAPTGEPVLLRGGCITDVVCIWRQTIEVLDPRLTVPSPRAN